MIFRNFVVNERNMKRRWYQKGTKRDEKTQIKKETNKKYTPRAKKKEEKKS